VQPVIFTSPYSSILARTEKTISITSAEHAHGSCKYLFQNLALMVASGFLSPNSTVCCILFN